MPRYQVTSPDGKSFEVTAPDGATQDQVLSYAQQQFAPPAPQYSQAALHPEANVPGLGTISAETSTGFNPAAALIKAGDFFSKIRAGGIQAQYGPVDWLRKKLDPNAQPTPLLQAIDQEQASNKPAIDQLQAVNPGSSLIGDLLPALPVPWRALPVIAASEYGSPGERALKGGAAWLGGKLMQKGGQVVADAFKGSQAQAATNAAMNAATQPFRDAGFVAPPEQLNPTLTNQVLGGISGGAKNEQAAARVNEPRFVDFAKQALGVGPNEKLSVAGLTKYRADQYATGYKPLASLPSIKEDQTFISSLPALSPASAGGAVPNPAQNAIDDLTTRLLNKGEWTGQQWLSDVRLLRESASANFSAARRAGGDIEKNTLARAQSEAANQLEALAERNGNGPAVQAMREARQKIAMSHAVEDALNDTTNTLAIKNIDVPAGSPLKLLQQFAEKYPNSAKPVDSATKANPFSVMDALIAAGPAMATLSAHGALPAAAVMGGGIAARPLLRMGIMSRPYQNFMTLPSERSSALLGTASKALNNPVAPRIGGLLGNYLTSP